MDIKNGLMVQSTKASGIMTRPQDSGSSNTQMVTSMKGSGSKIKLTARVPINTPMALTIRVTGTTISNTDMDRNTGLMAHNSKETTSKDASMVRANSNSQMVRFTKVNFKKTRSQDTGNISGLMASSISDSGTRTRCMVAESYPGATESNIVATLSMISAKVKAHLVGLMAENIKAAGRMANSTASGFTETSKAIRSRANGSMDIRFDGLNENNYISKFNSLMTLFNPAWFRRRFHRSQTHSSC